MFRNPTLRPATRAILLAAGCLLIATTIAAPAGAWPFGDGKAPPAANAPATATATAVKSDAVPPHKATAEQRATAARLDPLARAAFWEHELNLDPNDVQAGVGLSAALRALGKYDEAADTADRLVIVSPKNVDILLESARNHIAAGHGFYAIQPLKFAQIQAPKDWRALSLMGIALEQSERPDEALVAYDHALKLSPNNPAILSNLAMFHAARGETAQAEALLRLAAAQSTATPQERQNLALVLGLEGKTAEAEHLMRQDLPPEAADANLAYFRAASSPAPAPPPPTAEPAKTAQPAQRTWGSVGQSDSKGG